MGIPHYFYVITRSYEGILLSKLPKNVTCNHFMMDYNGLIHPASYKYLKNIENKKPKDIEKEIIKEVWNTTQDIIDIVKPTKTVEIFIDGVAPIAKMNQQRRRRFLAIKRKKMINQDIIWDSNAISPGTTFMTKLHASIRAYIRHNKKDFNYYFSSSDEAGEGEHKLFERLNRLYSSSEDVKLIYGMDADLIMLSLLSHIKNIYLLREKQQSLEEFIYLDIDKLRIGIIKDLKYNYGFRCSQNAIDDSYCIEAKQLIESYIVICFLLGNDFLPHSIGLQLKKGGLEEILQQASKLWNELDIPVVDIETETIQWTFIAKLLENLSKTEDQKFFDELYRYFNKKPFFDTEEQELEAYPLINKDENVKYLLFNIDRNKWRSHYYNKLLNCKINDSTVIINSCSMYLTGILWIYQYYKRKNYDPNWYYPYLYPPTLRDIANFLNVNINLYDNMHKYWVQKYKKHLFVNPIIQLISILPRESKNCLPIKYQKLMTENKMLEYLYPDEYQLSTFLKNYLWECSPILPNMNIKLVEREFNNIK